MFFESKLTSNNKKPMAEGAAAVGRSSSSNSTYKLAKELNAVEYLKFEILSKAPVPDQRYMYLVVIDFESTCWKKSDVQHPNEIIEFPAVIMNTSNGEIVSEFHMFVQPTEHFSLSDFCTKLTGVTQAQVEEAAPLELVLTKFKRWISNMTVMFNFSFVENATRKAAFVTWTDWDLGHCLRLECKRKCLIMPKILHSWIDLKALYKVHYQRTPNGLGGAMEDLSLKFKGRQHSGIADSRNTAKLAYKMIQDECVLKLTRASL